MKIQKKNYNTEKRWWQDILSVFPLAISNKHCFPWMKCVSFPALHNICTASLTYLSNLSVTVTTRESKTLFRQKDETNKRWKIKRLSMSFSLGLSKWGWFHAPVIRAMMRRDEREGGQGWDRLQVQRPTNVSVRMWSSVKSGRSSWYKIHLVEWGKRGWKRQREDRERRRRFGAGVSLISLL